MKWVPLAMSENQNKHSGNFRFIGLKLFLSCLIFTASCAFIAHSVIEKPKLTVQKIDIRDANRSGAVLIFDIEVENPNLIALTLKKLRYAVEIGSQKVGAGQIDGPTEILANKKTIVTIPMAVKYTDIVNSLTVFLLNGESRYRLTGQAEFGIFVIPFDQAGEVKLKN
jgi:LEA14-like dessication related protein